MLLAVFHFTHTHVGVRCGSYTITFVRRVDAAVRLPPSCVIRTQRDKIYIQKKKKQLYTCLRLQSPGCGRRRYVCAHREICCILFGTADASIQTIRTKKNCGEDQLILRM